MSKQKWRFYSINYFSKWKSQLCRYNLTYFSMPLNYCGYLTYYGVRLIILNSLNIIFRYLFIFEFMLLFIYLYFHDQFRDSGYINYFYLFRIYVPFDSVLSFTGNFLKLSIFLWKWWICWMSSLSWVKLWFLLIKRIAGNFV